MRSCSYSPSPSWTGRRAHPSLRLGTQHRVLGDYKLSRPAFSGPAPTRHRLNSRHLDHHRTARPHPRAELPHSPRTMEGFHRVPRFANPWPSTPEGAPFNPMHTIQRINIWARGELGLVAVDGGTSPHPHTSSSWNTTVARPSSDWIYPCPKVLHLTQGRGAWDAPPSLL